MSLFFFRKFSQEDHTATQVKQEILMHLEKKDKIEASIPTNIVIGPFWVNCEQIRQMLSKKCKTLANSVLEVLAKKLRSQADSVCDEFKLISRKLYEKPNGIEELTEQREYIKTLPVVLREKQDLINKAMVDYELIEEFYYSISVDDFNAKYASHVDYLFLLHIMINKEYSNSWASKIASQIRDVRVMRWIIMGRWDKQFIIYAVSLVNIWIIIFGYRWGCIAWPNKIEQQIEQTLQNQETDEERFHKNLLSEQNLFQDRLDGLNMVVAGFSAYNDLQK